MCRWLAYTGGPLHLEDMLFKATHSLIDQSMSSKSAETPTNGDGFGVGWYGERETPGLYRSIRPAWNDFNLRDLAAQIRSSLFLAHVRATSLATVQETNCHPFRHKQWLFVHNGEIFEVEKIHRDLLFRVDPAFFGQIMGSTDSELMFHLALTLGLEQDPLGSLERMVGLIENIGRRAGIDESVWMTVGVSDGQSLHVVRYASDGQAPTLYHSRDIEEIRWLNPHLSEKLTNDARVVVSEPIGKLQGAWVEIPQNTAMSFRNGAIESRPFTPSLAS
jgi:glutamine amidotransferase